MGRKVHFRSLRGQSKNLTPGQPKDPFNKPFHLDRFVEECETLYLPPPAGKSKELGNFSDVLQSQLEGWTLKDRSESEGVRPVDASFWGKCVVMMKPSTAVDLQNGTLNQYTDMFGEAFQQVAKESIRRVIFIVNVDDREALACLRAAAKGFDKLETVHFLFYSPECSDEAQALAFMPNVRSIDDEDRDSLDRWARVSYKVLGLLAGPGPEKKWFEDRKEVMTMKRFPTLSRKAFLSKLQELNVSGA
ncbi:hypothetical protein VTN02DRAFT_952 [Thermoascus thermophilus]